MSYFAEDENIGAVLKRLGFKNIVVCKGWQDALSRAKDEPFCSIIIDYNSDWEKKELSFSQKVKDVNLVFAGLKDDELLNTLFDRFEIEDFLLRGLIENKYYENSFDSSKLINFLGADITQLRKEIKSLVECLRNTGLKLKYGSSKCVLWIFFQRYYTAQGKPWKFNKFWEQILNCVNKPEDLFSELTVALALSAL